MRVERGVLFHGFQEFFLGHPRLTDDRGEGTSGKLSSAKSNGARVFCAVVVLAHVEAVAAAFFPSAGLVLPCEAQSLKRLGYLFAGREGKGP